MKIIQYCLFKKKKNLFEELGIVDDQTILSN